MGKIEQVSNLRYNITIILTSVIDLLIRNIFFDCQFDLIIGFFFLSIKPTMAGLIVMNNKYVILFYGSHSLSSK